MAERAAEIETGAGRRASSIIEDVAMSSARMLEGWADVPDYAWSGITRDSSGLERPLAELPLRRWQEVEVHLIDIGHGPTYRDWSDAFVAARLPHMRAGLAARLSGGDTPPVTGALDERDELVWLYGRSERADLPVLGPWS
jgi:maleylpyruvate isomerase